MDAVPEAILISDIHLGFEVARHKELASFLSSIPASTKLIINGDVLHEPSRKKILRNGHGAILDMLSRRNNTVIIAGNHDVDAHTLAEHTNGGVVKEYVLESHGKKFLVFHGHQLDPIADTKKSSWRRKIGTALYQAGTYITRSEKLIWFLRDIFERILGALFPIKQKAVVYARKKNYDGVIVGHSHRAEIDVANGVIFANSGAWLKNRPCTYLTVRGGTITLHTYKT